MTLRELYFANDNWTPHTTLTLVDEDFTIIKFEIEASLADCFYGKHEVFRFNGNSVMLKKEDKTNV